MKLYSAYQETVKLIIIIYLLCLFVPKGTIGKKLEYNIIIFSNVDTGRNISNLPTLQVKPVSAKEMATGCLFPYFIVPQAATAILFLSVAHSYEYVSTMATGRIAGENSQMNDVLFNYKLSKKILSIF